MTGGHLRQPGDAGKRTLQQLSEETGMTSLRLLERLGDQVLGSLLEPVLEVFNGPRGEELMVSPL